MRRNTILSLAGFTVVGLLSLGASCQKVGDSLSRGGLGLDQISTGNSETDRNIRMGKTVVAGSTELMGSFDPGEQELIGQMIAVRLASSPGFDDDEKLNDYVTKVGLMLWDAADRPDIDFTFGVLSGSQVNAISAPRGYVFVTREALMRMNDESELAGVLAHEIAHVVKNHGVEYLRNSKLAARASDLGKEALNNAPLGNLAEMVTDYATSTLYSQGQETDADALAVKLLAKAGYDASALGRYVQRIGGSSGGSAGGTFSSHPSVANRVAALNAAAQAYPGGQKLADRFAANVKK